MYSVLNCHTVAKHTEFTWDSYGNASFFQKELYNGIPNVTLWRVLRKRLHLKAYKLPIVQHLEKWIVYTTI
jgi:hypothetical protein